MQRKKKSIFSSSLKRLTAHVHCGTSPRLEREEEAVLDGVTNTQTRIHIHTHTRTHTRTRYAHTHTHTRTHVAMQFSYT